MPDYRRAHVPGGTYFFTVSTYRRQRFSPMIPDSREQALTQS
jgi:REP element-mobilizing transposase RayT